jgi:hypothetical protein
VGRSTCAVYGRPLPGMTVVPLGHPLDMATQLRLVETPTERRPSSKRSRAAKPSPRSATRVQRVQGARRAGHWGEWQLDARTRRVGREGVAAARRALAHAEANEQLSQAS